MSTPTKRRWQADEVLTKIQHSHARAERAQRLSEVRLLGTTERRRGGRVQSERRPVSEVKIAVGCAGPAPRRVAEAEALLEGKSKDEALRHSRRPARSPGRAAQAISDLHGSQEYKEHIVGVLLKRAFQSALS